MNTSQETQERNSAELIEHQQLQNEAHTRKPLEKNQHLMLPIETKDPGNPTETEAVEGLQQKVTCADINKLESLNWLGLNWLAKEQKKKGCHRFMHSICFFS